jgi:hypothetical protein
LGQDLDIEAVGEKTGPYSAVIQAQRSEVPLLAHIDEMPTARSADLTLSPTAFDGISFTSCDDETEQRQE